MVDTVLVRIDGGGRIVELEQQKVVVRPGGAATVSGRWRGLTLSYREEGGLTVSGSLATYWFGSNARMLRAAELAEVVGDICEALAVDARETQVCRLDLAATLQVSDPPEQYLPIYQSVYRMVVGGYGRTTKTFRNGRRQIELYDKGRQAKLDGHLLRIELRQLRRVRETFGSKVTLYDLANPSFAQVLARHYRLAYQSIRRVYRVNELPPYTRMPEYKEALMALGIQAAGGLAAVEADIQRKGITCRTKRSNMRALARELAVRYDAQSRDRERATEVDEGVEQALDYFLGIEREGGYPLVYGV